MPNKLRLSIRRYLTPHQFVSDLRKLHAFRGTHIGNSLLESLESSGLLKPRIRLQWPEPVARRLWLNHHTDVRSLHDPIEPDGPRWSAALRLSACLQTAGIRSSSALHPFDDPEPEFAQFIQTSDEQIFAAHENRRVSVANDKHPVLFDSSNVADFYSGWQVLAAAEVADMGVHIRTNMADRSTAERVRVEIREGRIPKGYVFELFDPVRATAAFEDHEDALDAIVWSVEEANRALVRVLVGQGGGRVRLSEAQASTYREEQRKAAFSGLERYDVCKDALLKACKFLSSRWAVLDSEGRSIIAESYKVYLAHAVRLIQIAHNLNLDKIVTIVGHQSNHTIPTLRAIWPDWEEEQKQRVIRTLRPTTDGQEVGELSLDEVRAFANFISEEFQDAIFLRLESFENYAFEDLEASLAGMVSDIQGMAVAVEHAVRAMGGTRGQLFQMFRQLWKDPNVKRLLGQHKQLAEQALAPDQWSRFRAQIDCLRNGNAAEATAADLIMAHRLRASVHHFLPEDDHIELEKLFVVLLPAAALTHAHVARKKTELLK